MTTIRKTLIAGVATLAIPFAFLGPVQAGSGHGGGHAGMHGEPGKAGQVTRTVEVVMYDNYYEPETITITEGETVRFKIRNAGSLVHEFNIGTHEMHVAHAPEMMMMVDHGVLKSDRIDWDAAKAMQVSMGHGMHDEPNSVLLEPGKSAEIIWKFPSHVDLEFACNVPGHYDAGMMGSFRMTH